MFSFVIYHYIIFIKIDIIKISCVLSEGNAKEDKTLDTL